MNIATGLLVAMLFASPGDADVPAAAWQSDWKSAFNAARDQRKLVFVDFFATWCGPCKAMEKNVFPRPEVQAQFARFVLLRVDVDRGFIARGHRINAFPTYVVYDPAERERFRIVGSKTPEIFAEAIREIAETTPGFIQAAELFDQEKPIDAELVTGNLYSHLRMYDQARNAYSSAHKLADRQSNKPSAQLADTLSAVTYAREGNAARALKLLQKLAAEPANRDTEALIWLTIGNVQRAVKDRKAAIEAYTHAQTLADPDSRTYKEAAGAIAALNENP